MTTRRSLLAAIIAGISTPFSFGATRRALAETDAYSALGITPFLNAGEPFTALSGAPIRPEVRAAMLEAGSTTVRLGDVQNAVGIRLAKLVGAQGAMITAGAASGLTLGAAACVTGSDAAKIGRLPDTSGMRNEIIIQRAHQHDYPYQRAVRNCGIRIVPVDTAGDLRQAISPRTACLLFNNRWGADGTIGHEEFVQLGRQYQIPTFNDCAADVPPAQNLTRFSAMGFDLVVFSGGKGLRGPSGTGLLVGRRDLIEAAKLNNDPYSDTIGRGMKVGKEEMIGLMVAVELCLAQRPDPVFVQSEATLRTIAAALSRLPGVETELFEPPVSYRAPHLRIRWDERKRNLTAERARDLLLAGTPPIVTREGPDPVIGLEITAWMLRSDDVAQVSRRLTEVLAHPDNRSGHEISSVLDWPAGKLRGGAL